MFYKLLIENSSSFKNKIVKKGALEFVETNEQGELIDDLATEFDAEELINFAKLVGIVWQHIMNLDFPDTDGYTDNMSGIKKFEQDLMNGLI
jgi:hypothetical protein